LVSDLELNTKVESSKYKVLKSQFQIFTFENSKI